MSASSASAWSGAPPCRRASNAGRPVEVAEEPTLADSLGGGIGLANRWTFPMVRDLVDEVVLVSESEIAAAMRSLFLQEGWVAEGAGAIGVALLEPDAARRSAGTSPSSSPAATSTWAGS